MKSMKPDPDICVEKVKMETKDGELPLLVLSPKGGAKDAPGVLWLHGGGYILGMKEMVHMSQPMELFEQEIRVQAFQNSVLVAMCNRVGAEGEMDFAGESIVVAANGQTVFKADDTEQLILVDVDLQEARRTRESRPYTALRRPELYQ